MNVCFLASDLIEHCIQKDLWFSLPFLFPDPVMDSRVGRFNDLMYIIIIILMVSTSSHEISYLISVRLWDVKGLFCSVCGRLFLNEILFHSSRSLSFLSSDRP